MNRIPKPVFIYCLKDPTTGDVRYIGQTNSLKNRLRAHFTTSAREKTRLGNWLRSLSEKPIIAVLHEVAEGESWVEEERRYISCARAMGVDLVNATDGGEGSPGHIHAPEHRAANSAAHKGVPLSPEHCAAISAVQKGVPKSPEHRAAMSAAKKGVPKSPEHRAAMRGPRGPYLKK